MDATAALMFALVFGVTLLPLVIVLPTAPPMSDDAPRIPRRVRRGWRITLSIGRVDAA